MDENDNNRPNTEKTSAGETTTLPGPYPTTELYLKGTSYNLSKKKSQEHSPNKSTLCEYKKLYGFNRTSKNLYKSKLTETEGCYAFRLKSYSSLVSASFKKCRSQIPIPHRCSLNNLGMSSTQTRSISPIKKSLGKESKPSNRIKTISLDHDVKRKNTSCSRSPSPNKKLNSGTYKKTKPRTVSPMTGTVKNQVAIIKQMEMTAKQQGVSLRTKSPTKKKSKTKVLSMPTTDFSLAKDKPSKESQKILGDSNHVSHQLSQSVLSKKDKMIQPQDKINLNHVKNEVCTGDHRRLSFEKLQLRIEKSVENLSVAESKRSYLVTYSSEDLKQQEEISLSFLQNVSSTSITTFTKDSEKKHVETELESKSAIRTLSGNELVLTPSMKLDIEKEGIENDIAISELLVETQEKFDEQKEIRMFQDDSNEYDSEMSSDNEISKELGPARLSMTKCEESQRITANSLWKSREAELLNDVDYRQSVYHPAVSRRQKDEPLDGDYRPKSRSIEDNFGFANKTTERIVRSSSSNLKNKYKAQGFSTTKNDSCNNLRSWALTMDKSDGKPIYNSVLPDVPLYGSKRVRTKKERIAGVLLRFSLKVMRLLALFNLWPGDNCYMLTSQSVRLAR